MKSTSLFCGLLLLVLGFLATNAGAEEDTTLVWWKNHLNPDGSFSYERYNKTCRHTPPCSDTGKGSDIEATSICLLSFLGAGHTHKDGKFKKTVKSILHYLKANQTPNGGFKGAQTVQDQAIAALAVSEAYGLANRTPLLQDLAKKSVDRLVALGNCKAGWPVRPGGPGHTVTTAWALLALKSARLSGLSFPAGTVPDALTFLDSVTDPATYLVGPGTGLPTNAKDLSPTAAALIARMFFGATIIEPMVLGAANLLLSALPKWDVAGGTIDVEYWYFGTLAMFHVGGSHWKAWNVELKNALVPTQLRKDCHNGSWDPVGSKSKVRGRLWSSALNTLSLEVYYCYGRVLGSRK